MKKIYFVRHGMTDWNQNKRCMGRTDIPLNKKGKEQAWQLARKIGKELADKLAEELVCYTSPLKRAKETAEIICAGKRIEIIPDDNLLERDCGRAQGQIVTDWSLYEGDETAENEESMMMRAKSFVETLKNEPRDHILVVSHSGPIKHIRHLFVTPNEKFDYQRWQIGNCEVCKIELK